MKWSSVEEPGLIGTVVANIEDGSCIVLVLVSVNINAVASWVSQVSKLSWVEGELLVVLIPPWSDDNSLLHQELLAVLVRDGVVSSGVGSDRFGS